MGGISSSVGLISGLNTDQIISQLLQIEARPKTLAQQRILQLQTQQAAFLDINGKIAGLKTAAAKFRVAKVFDTAKATSSDESVLTASATAGAATGSFSFLVSSVVSTQQSLSRGFTDRDSTALGLTRLTVEPEVSRLDRDTSLTELNGGNGVHRGKIEITDSTGARAVVDLSRAASINEVVDAINNRSDVRVEVKISGSKLTVTDKAGGVGTLRIADTAGYTTATELGIAGSAAAPGAGTITGSNIYSLSDSTALQTLNDGLGIGFSQVAGTSTPDFSIKTRDGSTYSIDVGDVYAIVDNKLTKTKGAVATVAQLRTRLLEQTDNKVTLQVGADGQSFKLVDSSTSNGVDDFAITPGSRGTAVADLGLLDPAAGDTITGKRVLASINSTLASSLRGGSGLTSGDIKITDRNGVAHQFTLDPDASIRDLLESIGTNTGGTVKASLASNGSAIVLTDSTGGSDKLIVEGQAAIELGIDSTGVESSTLAGTRLQRQYIRGSTLLSSLNAGQGIGTGTFEIVGAGGRKAVIDVGSDSKTIADIISEINSKNTGVVARINDKGDGITIEKDPAITSPSTKIKITDTSGNVAKSLNLTGEASDTTTNNFIDGSFERTITLTGTETLDELTTKINAGNTRLRATVIRDGSSATPFRLRLTSTLTGEAGRLVIDTAGGDLGLTTVTRGDNARIFFGADDPAKAILLSSTTNSFSNVLDGVTLTAQAPSNNSVTLTIAKDTGVIQTAVNDFVSAFNAAVAGIDKYTAYDSEREQGGPLLGDSTAIQLRTALFNTISRRAFGVTGGYQFLSQVGVRVGSSGGLEVDSAKLQAAIDNDPEGVKALFAASSQEARQDRVEVSPGIFVRNTQTQGKFTQQGVAELLATTLDTFTDRTGGILTRANKSINDQIDAQKTRITAIDTKLASRQAYLQNQFATLETTLARLQGQQSSLAGLASLAR